jgi:hypothetical protein
VNDGDWVSLNNRTANIEEPGKSYGGIGGGFATLKLTMELAAGRVAGGENRLEFRFNHTNGVLSGFRVLAFNLLTAENRRVIPAGAFVEDDPDKWVAPLPGQEDTLAGEHWWSAAALVVPGPDPDGLAICSNGAAARSLGGCWQWQSRRRRRPIRRWGRRPWRRVGGRSRRSIRG